MEAIQLAMTRLNLNERVVREKLVWGPVDLEVHRGKVSRGHSHPPLRYWS